LERALSLAEPGGYVRTFIEEGAPMAKLLRQSAARGAHPAYARDLLEAFETADLGTVTAEGREGLKSQAIGPHLVAPIPDAQPLIEPLTERELDVLRLLNTRLSIAEIAEELIVAVSTVRSHTKSIYGKLDVHSRMEAVRRAEEIGLL
jgi:LuxR family maltose regulon positive regulatory protein